MGKKANAINKVAKAIDASADASSSSVKGALKSLIVACDSSANPQGDSVPGLIEQIADVVPSGGGGGTLGETVMLYATESLCDFGFELRVGGVFAYNGYTDCEEGVQIGAGTDVYISCNHSTEGTYKIGGDEAKPLEYIDEGGGRTYMAFTIPADTPANYTVVVDGSF